MGICTLAGRGIASTSRSVASLCLMVDKGYARNDEQTAQELRDAEAFA